jgi:hypothetical protein
MTRGFHLAMLVTAGLAVVGGVVAWLTIDNDLLAAGAEPAVEQPPTRGEFSCAVAGPPLRRGKDQVKKNSNQVS